jgi:serine/threonine protein kinase
MSSPAPAPDRIGRYRIERKIGEGGMGVVYAARDERLDRAVALKTIRGDWDETARKRLWREARAAAGISHPNICQLYEVEETDDGLVLAMELLAGDPLSARLARGPLSPTDTSTIALQVLAALDALHSRGLIHRDLKPSNLFLTPHGVKLLDFGLARPMASSLGADAATLVTEAGAIVGTPNYMAPEQARGEALDGRADLFAMAAILFEMLSGKVAFGGATIIDVLHAVLHEQPPALSGGGTAAGLDRVIHKALQKQAADRYDSATGMAAAIREVIAARDSAELAAPVTRTMTRLIALPFRVLRPDAETDFLAFSLPDAITTSLTGTRNLLVRSSGTGAATTFAFDLACGARGIGQPAIDALDELRRVVSAPDTHRSVRLGAGDLLVVNNRKCAHARSRFAAKFDGTDRWLQRVYVRRSLEGLDRTSEQSFRVL